MADVFSIRVGCFQHRVVLQQGWLLTGPSTLVWRRYLRRQTARRRGSPRDTPATWLMCARYGHGPLSRATSTTTNTVLLYCTLDSIIGSDYTANMIVKIGVQLLLSVSLRPTAQKSIHGS
jgi:hypothetical protein